MSRGSYGNTHSVIFVYLCIVHFVRSLAHCIRTLQTCRGLYRGAFTPHAPGNSYSPHSALPTPYCGNSFTVSLAAPSNQPHVPHTSHTHTYAMYNALPTPITHAPPTHPQNRRLAAPAGAHYTDALALSELEGHVTQDRLVVGP